MDVILTNGVVIDGTGWPPISGGSVIIRGDKIAAVGALSTVELSALSGAKPIDLQGKTIMPGLINAHEHLNLRRGHGSFQERAGQPVVWLMLRSMRNALLALQEGVTTVRDLGSRDGNALVMKKAIADQIVIGPRVVACGQTISMTGGHGWQMGIEADGPDGVRRAARRVLKSGADLIKLLASGGFVEQSKDHPWSPQFSQDEMRAAFEEARKAGKGTTVHAHPPAAIRAAIEAGVGCIEHGALIDQETAELMAERGIYLVPTLGESWMTAEHGEELGRPAWLVAAARRHLEPRMDRFRVAVKAGVKVGVGTDVAASMALEMELMHRGGLSTMDTIVAATRRGAEICGLIYETGTLEVGKLADIIVIDGNPLDDIRQMKRIEFVFKGGRLYRPFELAAGTGVWPL